MNLAQFGRGSARLEVPGEGLLGWAGMRPKRGSWFVHPAIPRKDALSPGIEVVSQTSFVEQSAIRVGKREKSETEENEHESQDLMTDRATTTKDRSC